MLILKFGGSSVASAENVCKVAAIVAQKSQQNKLWIVVSALGGITDLLIATGKKAASQQNEYVSEVKNIEERHFGMIRQLIPVENQSRILSHVKKMLNQLEQLYEGVFLLGELSSKTLGKISAYGELLSSAIIAEALVAKGLPVVCKNTQELIITDDNHLNAKVDFTTTNKNIQNYLDKCSSPITIFPGFVAASSNGHITTLGRGGSDYTAAILAAASDANALEIWTDVNGIYTANPKEVKQAKPIRHISYQEAMELSHFGAKVIYPPTIQPVLEKNIPTWIKSTFEPDEEGSLITNYANGVTSPVKGISHIEQVSLITLEGSGMVGVPGFSKRLFEALAEKQVNVILITQASSEHSICIGIHQNDAEKAAEAVNVAFKYEIALHQVEPLQIEKDLAIIAIVGDKMKSHQGISGKMFGSLGKNNVNIRAIAQGASERNISAVIDKKDVKKALNTLHEAFFEDNIKQLNLFVVGVGNVGSKLIEQIQQQQTFLADKMHLNIRVVGISNSKKQYFNEEGINLENWKESLQEGEQACLKAFFEKINTLNLRNSILVDNTASEEVALQYPNYLEKSIAVVTCNKIACASAYDKYQYLKQLSRRYIAPFLFETNVGAGLPVINTLNNLIASGDEVHSIQAVLSGSLNFIFNHYQEGTTFYDIVQKAGEAGYTEPDPRIDLSGVDVMRKILILARESGAKLELEDISNESFLPETCQQTADVDSFLNLLKTNEAFFEKLRLDAEKEGCKLKYVAEFTNEKAQTGLKKIPPHHPFYHLEGKDNIILFYTNRYAEQPLIVKGAGAGADVTASGIFADIIKMGNI